MAALKNPSDWIILWDLNDASGPAQVQMRSITAREFLARDPSRWQEAAPANPGPLVGVNRRIIDGMYNVN